MQPLSRIHCVIPYCASTTLTSATTTSCALFLHSTSSAQNSLLQNQIQTRQIHRIAVYSPTSHHPQTRLSTSTCKSRICPAARSSPLPSTAPSQTTPFSTSPVTMSSDDAYMSFLDKANADLNAGRSQQQGASDTVRTETVDASTTIPAPLQSVDAYYVSDADEPFEPVALLWKGASKGLWPSAGALILPTYCIPDRRALLPCLAQSQERCMSGKAQRGLEPRPFNSLAVEPSP